MIDKILEKPVYLDRLKKEVCSINLFKDTLSILIYLV